jgi:Flp pilus assembly protein CpaB
MSGSVIPAYSQVNRDHLANPQTRQLNVIWLPKQSVSPDVLLNFTQIIGRVLDHEKPAGYAFTESDFMPKGTRAGLVAGIPPGKRSLTIEATKLDGVFGLRPGDHIDLLATSPIDSKGRGPSGLKGGFATQVQMAALNRRATVRPLAQDAVIVSPVTTRAKPVSSTSLMNGAKTTAVPVQEIVLAVEPDEVSLISEALATEVAITCVARSGRPDDPGPTMITPGSDPLSNVKVIETMSGNRRDTVVFGGDYSRDNIGDVADAALPVPSVAAPLRSEPRE